MLKVSLDNRTKLGYEKFGENYRKGSFKGLIGFKGVQSVFKLTNLKLVSKSKISTMILFSAALWFREGIAG